MGDILGLLGFREKEGFKKTQEMKIRDVHIFKIDFIFSIFSFSLLCSISSSTGMFFPSFLN